MEKPTHFYAYHYTDRNSSGTGNGAATIDSIEDINIIQQEIKKHLIDNGFKDPNPVITCIYKF